MDITAAFDRLVEQGMLSEVSPLLDLIDLYPQSTGEQANVLRSVAQRINAAPSGREFHQTVASIRKDLEKHYYKT